MRLPIVAVNGGVARRLMHSETYASYKSATVNNEEVERQKIEDHYIYPMCRWSINCGCQLAQMWQVRSPDNL